MPTLAEPSTLMSPEDVRALAGAVPASVMLARGLWTLEYSTARDGVSLHTLYRKAANKSPTLIIVREAGGFLVFFLATLMSQLSGGVSSSLQTLRFRWMHVSTFWLRSIR